jgi:hypothetical protein
MFINICNTDKTAIAVVMKTFGKECKNVLIIVYGECLGEAT